MTRNHRILLIAERAVLLKAAIATGLIVATMLLMAASAHASPTIECGRFGCNDARQVRHTQHTQRTQHVSNTGRPAACYGIPWCGCWGRLQVGLPKAFNLARHWLTLRHVSKRIGAWAVMPHHVGRVEGFDGNGNPILVSGNHNNRVGTGVYPARRILAYVEP